MRQARAIRPGAKVKITATVTGLDERRDLASSRGSVTAGGTSMTDAAGVPVFQAHTHKIHKKERAGRR